MASGGRLTGTNGSCSLLSPSYSFHCCRGQPALSLPSATPTQALNGRVQDTNAFVPNVTRVAVCVWGRGAGKKANIKKGLERLQ